jgi:hypothetical protein
MLLLIVFYAGAVLSTGLSWYRARTGIVPFSSLRDLTGIADRATLRRLFGLTRPDGSYKITWAEVVKHRRPAGVVLSDLPVHGLFLTALFSAALHGNVSLSLAVVSAAGLHAGMLAMAALAILAGSRQALTD